MYKLCSTEKSAAQQRRFTGAFLDLMLQMPYDSITISEICRQAGFSRKVFYRLFDQKADVLYALVDQTLLDYEHYTSARTGGGNLHCFFSYWKEQGRLLSALNLNQAAGLLTERAIRHVLREDSLVMKTFCADGQYVRETVIFFISGVFSLVRDWHDNGYDRSVEEMSQLLMNLLSTAPIKGRLPEQWGC